jgi:predicted Zn-ribbon and HTH transcriptional regulator
LTYLISSKCEKCGEEYEEDLTIPGKVSDKCPECHGELEITEIQEQGA